ncbi:Glycosyl hydrolases family 16 [Amycolatopsis arida]|uniref:Glycosyl hydrolases family 16 n=1 Tax=Amycolatopsis arida TaxID=587909 RepID=A0A1I5ZBF2_9PSEU|nr:family 16 glycosylhydrolase [Amycolatopsis arida]TDX89485.1 glycosyl hydrolase family 16 [Amycolatopsis arida]SFQ53740.1 Glycosyl hydrolases family 16 [Amycolatopsis arida]
MRRVAAAGAVLVWAGLVLGAGVPAGDAVSGPVAPSGAPGASWPVTFADEFTGDRVDRTKWTIYSDAEADRCLGNKGNQQLEWHTWDALAVGGGVLTMTARRNNPEPGYEWSGPLITTGQACGREPERSFRVRPGDYVETRLWLPDARGFWPSTWTWNGDGSNEQDTYEFYSDNHHRLYFTNHYRGRTGCAYDAPVDLTKDWHTIGEQLGPDETIWYLDGREVCRGGPYAGEGALLLDMFVYARIPPTVTEESMRVDYVRVHRR